MSLTSALQDAGFEVVIVEHYHEWLFHVTARKVAHTPPESLLHVPGDEAFVDAAYQAILRRPADAEGRAFHIDKLAQGLPRETVLVGLRHANE